MATSWQLIDLRGNYGMHLISVARGWGVGAAIAPPPNNASSELCRYVWKFVGTSKPTSMSFVPDKVSEVSTTCWKK